MHEGLRINFFGAVTMSNLRVRQIRERLRSLFEAHIDLQDLGPDDPQRDIKVLTRCLAAFAVYKSTGCTEAEAGAAVWDGSDDNGIDAAFYDPTESQVVIVQSKWIQTGSGEPSSADIAIFANGIKDLIEDQIDNFAVRLHPKVEQIGRVLALPGTTVHIVLVSTGASQIATHGQRNISRIVDELNGADTIDDGVATFEIMGLAEVFSALANTGALGRINLEATLLDWSYIAHPYPAYFGVIDGYQLKSWWATHGKRLVSRNIRHALGQTEVNIQIGETATNTPENFWYFNNGITLIAEEATRAPSAAASRSSGVFSLNGASIVNGAQTVSTISSVTNDESLGKVRVPVRVILLANAPDDFGKMVTRTNNLQNRVEGRDFVSEDPEQQRIASEMAIEGVVYEYQRSNDFLVSDKSCELVEVTTALACASGDSSHFVAVKTGVGRFYNDLSKAPYKTIFNPRTSGARAFNAVRVLRTIDAWIEARKRRVEKRSGYAWGVLVHGNRAIAASVFNRYGSGKIETPINDFDAAYATDIEAICESVYIAIVQYLETEHPSKFLAVLFKSPAKGREISDALKVADSLV